MDVTLIIFKPSGGQKQIPLKAGRYVIGRQKGVTLQIPLRSVSREHCELVIKSDSVKVRDLGSSNGTFRNNDRITEASLKAGDYLRIGELNMAIQVDGEPAEIAPPPPPPPGSAESSMLKTPLHPQAAIAGANVPKPADTDESEDLLASFGADESSMIDIDIDLDDSDAPEL